MKISYKRCIISGLFCILTGIIFSQEISYELNTNESGATKSYIARDFVSLKPGFGFKASGSNTLSISIDPGLLFIPSDNLYATPDGVISPNGGAVGAIPGSFSVSSTGGATYSIPIECPSGLNGLQPNISLVYNSQTGNSIMGWGWNVSGISSITRTGSTLYHDNKISPIQRDATDNLVLDGQRLILISQNNFSMGAKYRTEVESYNDITRVGAHFEVKTKDGWTLEYGSSADSRIYLNIGWLISKITDANGNYLKYSYVRDDSAVDYSDVRLDKIEYGGNALAGTSPVYTVNFIYNERPDVQSGFVYGSAETRITRLLRIIEIRNGSTLLRKYTVQYDYNEMQSKVTAIALDVNSSHYNPTQILWGNNDNTLHGQSLSPPDLCTNLYNQFFYADFNGDGRTDFLVYDNDTYKLSLYLADNSSNRFSRTSTIQLASNTIIEDLLSADFTGNGYCDFVIINNWGNETNKDYHHRLYIYNGNQFTEKASFNSSKKALAGDFDGDSKCELLNEETSQVLKFNGNSFVSIGGGGITWGTKVHTMFFPNNRYSLDFNGDGKTDVLIQYNDGYSIYTLKEEASGSRFTVLCSGDYPNKDTGVYFGDYNGDGKTDILTQRLEDNETALLFSKGDGFRKRVIPSMQKYQTRLFVGDYNGDGKSDFACVYRPPGANPKFIIGFGNTISFKETEYTNYPNSDAIMVSDFNGNGRDDILQNFYTSPCITGMVSRMSLYSFGKDDERLYVKGITNGLGLNTQINYRSTIDPEVYNCTAYTYTSPVSFLCFGMKVVSSFLEGAEGALFETKMKYYNGRIHRQGKGFLGFAQVESTKINQNEVTKTIFEYNNTFFNPYITKQTTSTMSRALVATIDYLNTVVPLGGKRIFPYVLQQTSTDHLTGFSSTVEISDFDDGNPGMIKTISGNKVKSELYNYIQKGAWCKNRIANYTSVSSSGQESYTRTVNYEYDDRGNLTKEIRDPLDEKNISSQYSYDTFGNIVQTDVTANGETRINRTAFSPSGIFVMSSTNEFGQTTTYDWNQSLGLLRSKRDYQHRITSYKYNDFGEVTETIYPDGIRTGRRILWAGTGGSNGAKYYQHEEISGQAPVITWYDPLGREIQKDTYGLNDKKVTISTQYNPDGSIYRVSEPKFGNEALTWARTYTYDSYRRPVSVETLMGTINTSYNGATTIVTSPDGVKETTVDEMGQIIVSKTNGKSVGYTYYPSGLMKTVLPEDRMPLSMEYDLQGNRTKLIDPDAGTVLSAYNAWGDILWDRQKVHLDKADIVTSYSYHNNGLLQQISQNGRTTVYTYDNQQRLNSVNIVGEHQQEFVYDNFDRAIQLTENIKGQQFIRSTEYDLLGRVKKEIYPSGYYVVNSYDKNGYLTETRDRYNTLIWQALASNAKGQFTHVKKGTRETRFTFDNRSFPVSIFSNGIIDLGFSFNNKGNLSYRTDNLTNQKEIFTYDNLNRLTQWDVYKNNISTKSDNISYGSSGTITSSSILDNYDYVYGEGNGKPDALTSIEGVPSSIPTSDLEISYTDFKKVKALTEAGKQYDITYGVDNQRRLTTYSKNGVRNLTRYYLGNYEKEINSSGKVRQIHYLKGGDGLAGIYVNYDGRDTLYYTYSDYQGSLLALTNQEGGIVERYAYDPWGNQRDPYQWAGKDTRSSFKITRGYTMHEHLSAFGLIDMNGRMYDPLTGMFLSPDPFVQAPDNWLNFNRYGYCYGNPFMYSDPSGEYALIDDLIAGVIGGVVNLVGNLITGDITNVWHGISSFGTGFAGGVVTLYAGPIVGGGIMGAGNSIVNQGFTVGWSNIGWDQVGINAGVGAVTGALTAGVGSRLEPLVGSATSNISSPVLREATTQAVAGAATGFSVNTVFALGTGSSVKDALRSGGEGAVFGFAVGTVSGVASGVRYAHENNLNPWTGNTRHMSKKDRVIPNSLTEQMTLKEAQSGQGRPIMDGKINDPYWKAWEKMEHVHRGEVLDTRLVNKEYETKWFPYKTTIHYWRNPQTGVITGFKFKKTK